jgi:hypothetical protein
MNNIIIVPTADKPIKLVDEGRQCEIKINDEFEMTVSCKLGLLEIAKILGVNIEDLMNNKIGYWIINGGHEKWHYEK